MILNPPECCVPDYSGGYSAVTSSLLIYLQDDCLIAVEVWEQCVKVLWVESAKGKKSLDVWAMPEVNFFGDMRR